MNFLNSLFFILNGLIICWVQIDTVEGILGGEDARPGQFSYNVAIFKNEEYVCSGVIISDKHVLTAAQCVISINNKFFSGDFWVVGGIRPFDLNYSENDSEVEKIYVPVDFRYYDQYGYNSIHSRFITSDIALLKIRTKFDFDNNSADQIKWRSTALSRRSESIDRTEAVVAGYGHHTLVKLKDSMQNSYVQYGKDSIYLKYVKTKILTLKQCQEMYDRGRLSHVCAQTIQRHSNIEEGTCKSDEGSGLILNDKTLIGILVKPTVDCNETELAGLYTRVSLYETFISDAINDKGSPNILVHYPPKRSNNKPSRIDHAVSQINI